MNLNHEFCRKSFDLDGKNRAEEITNMFNDLLNHIIALSTGSEREINIIRLKLEEASFYARKAIAFRTSNCERKE